MKPFAERWIQLARERSPLCVGVGMTDSVLEHWEMAPSVDALRELGANLLKAAADNVAGFELHTGFYERFGPVGLELLAEFTAAAHRVGSMVLLDAKRGGPADTNLALADLYLGEESVIGADGLVVHPYLGFTALQPMLDLAEARAACVFVIARTSNDGGAEIQSARLSDGRTVAEFVVDGVTDFNRRTRKHLRAAGPVGVVVGAECGEMLSLISRSEQTLFCLPGLGRRGRTVEEFRKVSAAASGRILLPITSDVLRHGPDVARLAKAIGSWRSRLRDFPTATCSTGESIS